ncbi:MAG: DNA primase [Longimicrobiales bacterium]
MIPDDVVEEIRSRADLVDVIGEFVRLKKSGKDYRGLCPFHDEKTPSFYVVPSKGFYNCFGCGASGDVFSFLMERQGMDFVEAVKWVGRRSGVEVREVRTGAEEDDHDRRLYEANAFARRFYRERLEDEEEGRAARSYLEERGIGEEAVERYGLGYAPDGWRALKEAAATHGIEESTLLEAGLVKESEKVDEAYDRFRNRIVFPIESVSGKVLGFGGRILPGEEDVGRKAPKYLNSPESPIYHKGEVLYGLGWAKNAIRREDAVLVVEGYMDAVALGAAGIEHVAAPLGTSMTEAQAELLRRYTKRVYLLFDSDAAGLRATFRAADLLLAAGLQPAVVTLPPGEDPDSVVRDEGAEALLEYVDQAVDVLDRKLQILDERDYFSSIEQTREAVDRLLPTLRAAADPALRDIYVAKVAERTGVRRDTLQEELARADRQAFAGWRGGGDPSSRSVSGGRGGPRRSAASGRAGRRGGRTRYPERDLKRRMGAERLVLWVLLHDPDRTYHESVVEQIGPDDFVDPDFRDLFRALVEEPDPVKAAEGMEARVASALEELLADDLEASNVRRLFQESVNRIRQKPLQEKKEELHRLLDEAVESKEEERKEQLLDELNRLSREQKDMGAGWESFRPAVFRRSRTNQTDEPSR